MCALGGNPGEHSAFEGLSGGPRVDFARSSATGSAKAVAISECGELLFAGVANTIRLYRINVTAPQDRGPPRGRHVPAGALGEALLSCLHTEGESLFSVPLGPADGHLAQQESPLAAVFFSPSEHVLGLTESRGLLAAYGTRRLSVYAIEGKGSTWGLVEAPAQVKEPVRLQQILLVKDTRRILAAEFFFLASAVQTAPSAAETAAVTRAEGSEVSAAQTAPKIDAGSPCCRQACLLVVLSDGCVRLLHVATGEVLLERQCSSSALQLQAAAVTPVVVQLSGHITSASCCTSCTCCSKGLQQRLLLLVAGGTAFSDLLLWLLPIDMAPTSEQPATAHAASNTPLQLVQRLEGHRGGLFSLAFAEGGTILASASDDREIRLWASKPCTAACEAAAAVPFTYHCISVLRGHRSRIWMVAFLDLLPGLRFPQLQPHGSCSCGELLLLQSATCSLLLLSAGEDSTVRIWSLRGPCLYTLEAHKGRGVRSLAVLGSALGASRLANRLGPWGLFATGGEDGCIKVWPVEALHSLWGALQRHVHSSSLELLRMLRRHPLDSQTLSGPGENGTPGDGQEHHLTSAAAAGGFEGCTWSCRVTPTAAVQAASRAVSADSGEETGKLVETTGPWEFSCTSAAVAAPAGLNSTRNTRTNETARVLPPEAGSGGSHHHSAAIKASLCGGLCGWLGGSDKDFVREIFFCWGEETATDTLILSTNYGHVYLVWQCAATSGEAEVAAEAEASTAAGGVSMVPLDAAFTTAGVRQGTQAVARAAGAAARTSGGGGSFCWLLLCCVPSPVTATGVSDECLCLGGADGFLRLCHLRPLRLSIARMRQHCQQRQCCDDSQVRPAAAGALTATEAFSDARVSSAFVFSLGTLQNPSSLVAGVSSNTGNGNTLLLPLARCSKSSSSVWAEMRQARTTPVRPPHTGEDCLGGFAIAGDHTGTFQQALSGTAGRTPVPRVTNRFMCCIALASLASARTFEGHQILSTVFLVGDEHGTLHVLLLQVPAVRGGGAAEDRGLPLQRQQQEALEWDWPSSRVLAQQPLAELHPRRHVALLTCSNGFVFCCGGDGRILILRVSIGSSRSSISSVPDLWVPQQVVVEQLQAVKVSQIRTFVCLLPQDGPSACVAPWWGAYAATCAAPTSAVLLPPQQQQQDGFALLKQHVAVGVRGGDLVGFSFTQEAPLLQLPCGDSKRSFAVGRGRLGGLRLAFSKGECVHIYSSSSSSSSTSSQSNRNEGINAQEAEEKEEAGLLLHRPQARCCVSYNSHNPGGDIHAISFLSPSVMCAAAEDNTLSLIACEAPPVAAALPPSRWSLTHSLSVFSITTRHHAAVRATAELHQWPHARPYPQAGGPLPRLLASAGAAQTLNLFQLLTAASTPASATKGGPLELAHSASDAASVGILQLGTLCLEDRNAKGPSANARFTMVCGYVSMLQQQSQSNCDAYVLVGVSTARLLLVRFRLSVANDPPAVAAPALPARTESVNQKHGASRSRAVRALGGPQVVCSLSLNAVPLCCQLVRLPSHAEATQIRPPAAAPDAEASCSNRGFVVFGQTDGCVACAFLEQRDTPPLLLPVAAFPAHQRAVTAVCVEVLEQHPAAVASSPANSATESCRLLICTSGDDDAISLAIVSLVCYPAGAAAGTAAGAREGEGTSCCRWRLRLLSRVMHPNVHGSSVRCLALCFPFLFSAGWDRWLQAWILHRGTGTCFDNNRASSGSHGSSGMRTCVLCEEGSVGGAAPSCCCRPTIGCFASLVAGAPRSAAQQNACLLDRQLEALWKTRGSPVHQGQRQEQQETEVFMLQRIASVQTGVAEVAALAACPLAEKDTPRGLQRGFNNATIRLGCAGASGGLEVFEFHYNRTQQ
ncbi:uncharacterized protein LOC34621262 [Cyclospora cayetanensis]|uniref:Uncharacterized protein LOC34621262 n=1 Tax=Cyclospora cayetanensis TaxID=88456 RepID=A0A6P6RQN6_9EIME|nr:uncharacterized protein LOC34621262 [Cyclospora cayetanensis]